MRIACGIRVVRGSRMGSVDGEKGITRRLKMALGRLSGWQRDKAAQGQLRRGPCQGQGRCAGLRKQNQPTQHQRWRCPVSSGRELAGDGQRRCCSWPCRGQFARGSSPGDECSIAAAARASHIHAMLRGIAQNWAEQQPGHGLFGPSDAAAKRVPAWRFRHSHRRHQIPSSALSAVQRPVLRGN